MTYRIWKECTIRVTDEEGDFLCISDGPLYEKYPDLNTAKKELKKLADSNFGYGKYRIKRIESITKVSDREYLIELSLKGEPKERYYILPMGKG